MTPQDKVFEFCKSPKSIVEIAEMLGVNDKRWVRKKIYSSVYRYKTSNDYSR